MTKHSCRISTEFKDISSKLIWFLLFWVAFIWAAHSSALSINTAQSVLVLPEFNEGTLGKYIQYFQERDGKLSLAQARQKFASSTVKEGSNNSISLQFQGLNFGIGNAATCELVGGLKLAQIVYINCKI